MENRVRVSIAVPELPDAGCISAEDASFERVELPEVQRATMEAINQWALSAPLIAGIDEPTPQPNHVRDAVHPNR